MDGYYSDKLHRAFLKISQKFVRIAAGQTASLRAIIGLWGYHNRNKQGENKTEGGSMLTYEQQTEKLLSKRQAVLDRIENDKAEIEKINSKLNAIQLAKIRDALGCDEQGLFELITKYPEQLAKLRQDSIAEGDTDTAQDSDDMDGQTSFFDKKHSPYED